MHNAKLWLTCLFLFTFLTATAHAEEGTLPIRVTLIKCGEYKKDIPKACKKDERCCVFMDQVPIDLAILNTPRDFHRSTAKFYDFAEFENTE